MLRSTILVTLVSLCALFSVIYGDGGYNNNGQCNPHYPYRMSGGNCNNLQNPTLGAWDTAFRRGLEGQYYGPGLSFPVGNIPHERVVSNKVFRSSPALLDPLRRSVAGPLFGQFLAHDLGNNEVQDPYEYVYNDFIGIQYANLPLPTDDSFCQVYPVVGYACNTSAPLMNACLSPYDEIPFVAIHPSAYYDTPSDCGGQDIRNILNEASSFIDLATVYSDNATQTGFLRTLSNGLLRTSDYYGVTTSCPFFFPAPFSDLCVETAPVDCIDCLPSYASVNFSVTVPNTFVPGVAGLPVPVDKVWVSGDIRTGNNIGTGMYTLAFVRNHNYWARQLKQQNPHWNDETLFQEARRWNIAEYQNIVAYEYLPTIGVHLPHYPGYSSSVDPRITISFDTAAFRGFGHSQIANYIPLDQNGNPTALGFPVPATDTLFFAGQVGGFVFPLDTFVEVGSFENQIRGSIAKIAEPIDVMIEDLIRDIPFNCPVAGGTDVATFDLHRARENGLPPYLVLRNVYTNQPPIYGCEQCPYSTSNDPIGCFNLITSNTSLAANLQSLYGKVSAIDAMVGLIAENGAVTLTAILTDSFGRSRNGDRFWFENSHQPEPFTSQQLNTIKSTTMRTIFLRNFNFAGMESQIPTHVFYTPN